MPVTLGNDLANYADRYYIDYEEKTKIWRIIDLKNPEILKVQDVEEEIPDDHPAVTIISEIMFAKLITEAIRIGVLAPSVAGIGSDVKDVKDLKEEIEKLEKELNWKDELVKKLEQEKANIPQGSEKFILKKHAMNLLFNMTVAEDINETKSIS